MKPWLIAVAGVSLGMCAAATASAQPSSAATIAVSYSTPLPSGPPYVVSGTGTFSSSGSVSDAGPVDVIALYTAVPSPVVGVLQSTLTLQGQAGTIDLGCTQVARDFGDSAAVPDTGTCTVVGATGIYAGVQGTGKVVGSADLTGTQATVTETVALSTH